MMQPLEQLDDKYEILHKLTEGGMGAIYKVRHRLLDELRVVKVMRPHAAADPTLRRRFLREAKVAIKVRHPNIAQLFDFSMVADGTSLIIMEFIDGVTLQEVIRSGERPSLSLAVEIGMQGLQALSCLHHSGIVHRDISNDNLMLTRGYDGRPVVKLIDLGIAKDPGGEAGATATGSFLGKARYSAPEQFRGGGAGALGPSADLYSFGVVLYELLTGTLPFEGEGFAELVTGHLFNAPIPFERSDPEGRIPEGLREVVLHALAKAPADRIASADEFMDRIKPFGAPADLDVGGFERLLKRAKTRETPAGTSARESLAGQSVLLGLGRRKLNEGDAEAAISILREGLAIDPELVEARPILEDAERHLAEQRDVRRIAEWATGLDALLFPEAPDRGIQEVLEVLDAARAALDARDERARTLMSECRRLLSQSESEPDQKRARQKLDAASRALAQFRTAAGDSEVLVELDRELERVGAILEERYRARNERLALRVEQASKELAKADAERKDPGGDLNLALRMYQSARAHFQLALDEDPTQSEYESAIERIDASLRLVTQEFEQRQAREEELSKLMNRAAASLDEAERLAGGTEADLERRLAVLDDGRDVLERARELDPGHTDVRRMTDRHAAMEADTTRELDRRREERVRAEAREAEATRLFDRCRELAARSERFEAAGVAELEQAIQESEGTLSALREFVGDDAVGRSARDLLRTVQLVRGEADRFRRLLLEREEREKHERERELERQPELEQETERERELARERDPDREPEPDPTPGRRRWTLVSIAAAIIIVMGVTGWWIVTSTREGPLERGIRLVLELPEDDERQLREKLKQIKALIPRLTGADLAARRRSLEVRQERLVLLVELQRRLDNLVVHRESVEDGTVIRDPAWETRQYWNTLETGVESFLGSYPNDPTADRLRTQGREELQRIQQHLQSPELADLLE